MGMMAALLCCLLLALPVAQADEPMVTVKPQETNELFANPGMGWQTFHTFNDQDRALQGLPSGSAYFRFYWREIEPTDGAIDFARLDEMLAHGRRVGQKVALRIMCTGSENYADSPLWLRDAGCKGLEVEYEGHKHWLPDFTDPIFRARHGRLIRELGKRYDGNSALDTLDIGSVGLWGEWHMSGVKDVATGNSVPMPPVAVQNEIISEWCAAFPKTPKVVLIGSDAGMARTMQEGLGWRADCLGDMGGFSKTWNHMENFYPQAITKARAQAAWQQAPVAFESCWDMRKWKQEGWDIAAIFDFALAHHASYVNNKSTPLPEEAWPLIERFLHKLGYRLVIRSLAHAPRVRAGETLTLKLVGENVSVAPPYFDYHIAIRLKRDNGQPLVLTSQASIRGWLPGTRTLEAAFPLPAKVPAGRYELAVGVVEPQGDKPAVRLAIEGRDAQGWYPLSRVEVAKAKR
ncbi:MAG: DUF4832 domain-containing protein [Abitibacteriaceae bacterium]|nr:DUF4832 domain-containing protein [Abditibacteriaceae bacterium]MBV9866231.1 DUF4832 domain-containing protein [Abditibacteriaceae bacterium]